MNLGYKFNGWVSDNNVISTDNEIELVISSDIEANFEVRDEMKKYEFISTPTSCLIRKAHLEDETEAIIPSYVTGIKMGAFKDCIKLEKITLPFIGSGDSSNTHFGYIFDAESSFENSEYVPSSLKEVIISNGCTSIDSCAFQDCSGLTSIIIPNSVTSIGKRAFWFCSGLTSITIPNSVTSIGELAFSWCSGLTSITIPNSVTSIGDYAFEACSGLTSIIIPNSVTSIEKLAFSFCSGLSIYCEVDSKPSTWDSNWKSDNLLVVWGYSIED